LKYLSFSAKLVLLQLCNLIWNTRILPSDWKHAIIIPSIKANRNKFDPLSYRPIALTSNICKLMEKMVNNRLRWFLETNSIYTNFQCGFRKKIEVALTN